MGRVTAGVLAAALVIGVAAVVTTLRAPPPGAPERTLPPPPSERVRVEVRNAGGVPDMARLAAGALRDAGFDVVGYGNAGSFDRDSTEVIDRVGRPELAEHVRAVLGVGSVSSEADPELFLEVTVLLGADWSPDGAVGEGGGDAGSEEGRGEGGAAGRGSPAGSGGRGAEGPVGGGPR